MMVLCKACDKYLGLLRDDGQHHDQVGYDVVMMILDFCKEAKSVPEIMENFGFESRTSFRRKYLNALVEEGRLKMTMPDKPKSKNQKYYSSIEMAINQLEILARRGYFSIPKYEYTESHDKNGNPIWHVECHIDEMGATFDTEASSKKQAKKEVALEMLQYVLDN